MSLVNAASFLCSHGFCLRHLLEPQLLPSLQAFVALGMITGLAWPVAASLISGQNVAATLESFDHLGAALLAAITGVGLLPLYGTRNTLWILAGLVLLAAISAATDRLLGSQKGKRFLHGRIGRALTHAVWPKSILWPGLLALFAILAVIVPNLGDRTPPGLSPRISHEDIRRIEQAKGIEDFFNPFFYSRLEGTEKGEGIIIATTSVLPDAKGWAAPSIWPWPWSRRHNLASKPCITKRRLLCTGLGKVSFLGRVA